MKAFYRLAPLLDLTPSQLAYLENLVKLAAAPSQDTRLNALERLEKFTAYQNRNPNEARFIRYMTRWYHLAIRELASIPGFQLEPRWIQKRLKSRVPLREIRAALDFLLGNGFLAAHPDGTVTLPEKHLDCAGEVYKGALTQYHKQIFALATRAIDDTPGTERNVVGHTISIDPEQYATALKILSEAMEKIQSLPESASPASTAVYQVELAMFPLTKRRDA